MEDWILERGFVLWLGTHTDRMVTAAESADRANEDVATDGHRIAGRRRQHVDVGEELREMR